MKIADIEKLQAAGLISGEQSRAIVQHFHLDEESSRFQTILGFLGGIIAVAGIILLIASNWDAIPQGLKILGTALLMISFQASGWWATERGRKPVMGAVLHLVGSGLFLALIAVVGQVYHLSSSPGNAVLLWLAGVAPLAWILRLRSQLILSYAGFGAWLWLELIDSPGHAQFGGWFREVFLYVSVGAAFVGCGMHLALTRFKEFAGTTEKFGLLLMNIAAFPLCIGEAYEAPATSKGITLSLIIATLAVGLVTLGIWRNQGTLDGGWKKLWGAAIAGLVLVATLFITYVPEMHWHESRDNPYHWGANVAVFLWCLAQIRVGILRRNKWLLNIGMTFAGITLIAAYFNFSSSLEARGIVFMVGGILMVAGALVMERVRRRMIRKMAPGNPV